MGEDEINVSRLRDNQLSHLKYLQHRLLTVFMA